MLAHTLILALAAPVSHAAPSSDPAPVTEANVRVLARQVAAGASNFQWQQLWQQARSHGRFKTAGPQPRFTLPQRELPALARQVLAAPDHIVRQGLGQAALRRDFTPQVTGLVGNLPVSGLCLTLAWSNRSAQPHSIGLQPLHQADLSLIEPC